MSSGSLVPRDEPAPTWRDEGRSGSVASSGGDSSVVDLSRYVAIHVRHLYEQRKGEPLKEPLMQQHKFGVVAMADVSGYSHLTNHLKNRQDGAELLTQLLNPYFHFVIDIIEKSGGDVVKFIGDAILVKWELKDQSKAECVALACSGCLRLLERLGNHFLTIPDEDKAFPLSMHIGLGVGEVYDMHVGSERYKRWEYFLDGKALSEAVKLVNVANQRELVISDDTLACMQGEAAILQAGIKGITTERTKKGGHILKSLKWLGENDGLLGLGREKDSFAPKAVYKQYLNESAAERLLGGHLSLINELRKVSVMFARFSASDVAPDDARMLYQKAMVGALEIIRNYQGTLRQMVTDDKGTSILIVFGLPPLSHENDALFGLRAALELRRLLCSLFSAFAISVTTGTLFSGIVGGRTRADHTIMGEVVNLAARLMISDMCDESIYCDKETRESCLNEITFDDEPIEFVTKKGKATVFKVLGLLRETLASGAAAKSSAAVMKQKTIDYGGSDTMLAKPEGAMMFVGREDEMAKIAAVLTDFLTTASAPPRLFIEGDGGTGKSSMFSYAVEQALLNGIPSCVAKGDEVDQSTPFFVFRDLVLDLVDLIHEELPSPTGDEASGAGADAKITRSTSDDQMPALVRAMRQASPKAERDGAATLSGVPGMKKSGRSRSLYRSIRMSGVAVDRLMSSDGQPVRKLSDGNVPLAPDTAPGTPNPASTGSLSPGPANGSLRPSPNGSLEFDADDQRIQMLMNRFATALDKICAPKNLATTLALAFTIGDIGRSDVANVVTIPSQARPETTRGVRYRASSSAPAAPEKLTKLDALADVLVRVINQVTLPPKAPRSGAARTTPLFPNGLALALDDAQWIDGLSWTMLQILARRCPRLLLVFAMRPLARNVPEPCARLQTSPEARVVTLGGLKREAVSKLIATIYGEQVRSVQDRLLEAVMEKTGGNPLFVVHVARGLKTQRNLAVSPTFELFAKGRQGLGSDLDVLVPKDLQSAMLVQFDRIEPTLQLILRVASVIGNTFSLDMVAHVTQTQRAIGIRECLEKLTSAEASLFVGSDSSNVQDVPLGQVVMVFKSALLQKCVYSTMLVSERSKVHSMVAHMYEDQLNDDNRQQFLPIILHHYEKTSNMFKRIQFLEGMAELHMFNNLYADAAVVLKKLLHSLPMLEADKKIIFTNDRRARWHKNLGQSYVAIYDWELGKGHLLESLKYLDVHLPSSKNALRWATVKLLSKQSKYWAKRNQPDRQPEITNEVEVRRTVALIETLLPLGEAFIYLSENDEATWCVLTRLNLCEALGETACSGYDLHFARVEAIVALSLHTRGRIGLAAEYFQRAEQIANRAENPLDLVNVNMFRGMACFMSGNARECIRLLDINNQLIDVNGLRCNDSMLVTIYLDFMSGQLNMAMRRAREMFHESIDHGEDVFNVMSAATMVIMLDLNPTLADELEKADSWMRVLVGAVVNSMRQLGSAGSFGVLCSMAYHFAVLKDWGKFLEHVERIMSILSSLMNPTLGMIFTPSLFFLAMALLKWHQAGLPMEAGFQPSSAPHGHIDTGEEDAFGSALTAAGLHETPMEQHTQTMTKPKPSRVQGLANDKAEKTTHSWGASVGDRALKTTMSRESFDTPHATSETSSRVSSPAARARLTKNTVTSTTSTLTVDSSSSSSSAPPSPVTSRAASDNGSGRRLFMSYVTTMLKQVRSFKKTWAPVGIAVHQFEALEQLDRGATERASALFEKAALAVPQGLFLLKVIVSVEALRHAPPPRGKKATTDRRKRLDELAEQAKALSLPGCQADVALLIARLPPA